MGTPVTPGGLRKYDGLPSAEAVRRAWTDVGRMPEWHAKMQDQVRRDMPLLARALDRLAEEKT